MKRFGIKVGNNIPMCKSNQISELLVSFTRGCCYLNSSRSHLDSNLADFAEIPPHISFKRDKPTYVLVHPNSKLYPIKFSL